MIAFLTLEMTATRPSRNFTSAIPEITAREPELANVKELDLARELEDTSMMENQVILSYLID
jgi:hypothetical protein